jgi:hypothetical protein
MDLASTGKGLALSAALAAAGCSSSSLAPPPAAKVNNVVVTGAIQGMFSATVATTYNLPSKKQQTVLHVLGKNPGLGIGTFAFDAVLGGPPEVGHYDERPAQITAGFYMLDNRIFESDVNSMLTIDISSVSAPDPQPDGSSVYTLEGVGNGHAPTLETSDIINFVVTL